MQSTDNESAAAQAAALRASLIGEDTAAGEARRMRRQAIIDAGGDPDKLNRRQKRVQKAKWRKLDKRKKRASKD